MVYKLQHYNRPGLMSLFGTLAVGVVIMLGAIKVLVRRHNPVLSIAKDELALGTLWARPDHKAVLQITNNSDDTVTIEKFQTSCACTSVNPPSLNIDARSSRSITLTIDFTAYAKNDSEKVTIQLMPVLANTRKGSAGPVWTLQAVVQQPYTQSTAELDFGELYGTSHVERSLEIQSLRPLSSCHAESLSPFVAVEVKSSAEASLWHLVVKAIPHEDQLFKSVIVLYGILDTGEALPPLHVPVRGMWSSDVYAVPSRIIIGGMVVGDRIVETVRLLSHTAVRFDVASVDHSSDALIVMRESADTYTVQVYCSKAGREQFNVRFLIQSQLHQNPLSLVLPVDLIGFPTNTR